MKLKKVLGFLFLELLFLHFPFKSKNMWKPKRCLFTGGFITYLLIISVCLPSWCCKASTSTAPSPSPSSCGHLRNISCPFRLKGDHQKCDDISVELSCQNNRTVLNFSSHKYDQYGMIRYNNNYYYYVEDINYDQNYSVRVVDPGLVKDNYSCSSLPVYSFPEIHSDIFSKIVELNTPITFIDCPVPAISTRYIDTAPCSLSSSVENNINNNTYSYAVIGDMDLNYFSCGLWYNLRVLIAYIIYHISNIGRIFGIVYAARFLCRTAFLLALIVYKLRRRHLSVYDTIEDYLQGQTNLMPIRYNYSDMKKITNSFKEKLGEGGFGTVYKGKLRSGLLVAVKILGNSKASGQEFINEVATIGRIHHVNVVQLLGFCFEGPKRALIYEFMPNGSLEKYIFPRGGGEEEEEKGIITTLTCEKMYEISFKVAGGVEYLHRGCDMQILHFDIKPHNILLDENFNPKISDFGLAKLYATNDSIVTLTAARGTMVIVALWCIQMKPIDRPSMNKVIEMLQGDVQVLVMPPKPFLCPQEDPDENQEIECKQN